MGPDLVVDATVDYVGVSCGVVVGDLCVVDCDCYVMLVGCFMLSC